MPFLLRLSDFMPLVKQTRDQTQRIILARDGMDRFVLRPQGDGAAGTTALDDTEFRVIGVLNRSIEDAVSPFHRAFRVFRRGVARTGNDLRACNQGHHPLVDKASRGPQPDLPGIPPGKGASIEIGTL